MAIQKTPDVQIEELYNAVKEIISQSRNRAYSAVNAAMVSAYWSIGQLIVEREQKGEMRAEYGKSVLQG